jgi:hypothetical protein
MIKIKARELFAVEGNNLIIDKINPAIEKFLNHPFRSGVLKYDIQNKLGRRIYNEIIGIAEFRSKLIEENPPEIAGNIEIINIKLGELLNSEISINARPVSLEGLIKEDCSEFDFQLLDPFICGDRIKEE